MKTPYEFYLTAFAAGRSSVADLLVSAHTIESRTAVAVALSNDELLSKEAVDGKIEQLLHGEPTTLLPVQRLLAALTEKWPPVEPRKHGIVLADDGRLLVNISLDLFHRFALDEADMRKSPSEIIAVIEPMLTATLSVLERHATIHDDGREWMGDIELSDGQIAVGEALTGNTVFLRLGELKLEFHRVTGAGITAPELSIAKHELYRIHPVTYQMRQEQNRAVRFTDLGIPTDPPPPV